MVGWCSMGTFNDPCFCWAISSTEQSQMVEIGWNMWEQPLIKHKEQIDTRHGKLSHNELEHHHAIDG